MAFAHLHVHSQYSILDGMCRVDKIMDRVMELGQTAIALTDHGVMYGVVDFYKAAKAAGIKPIIGCEVYVAPRSREQKVKGIDNANYHLILLCENETGYKNLCYLVSQAYLTGFYYKPRVDKELLKQHHEGLIALSACLSGEIPVMLQRDEPNAYELAKAAALEMSEIFGPEHFYLELQNHHIPAQGGVNRGLRRIAKELNLPTVVTNDAHYLTKEDAPIQEMLMCIYTGKTLSDSTHMKFDTDEFYLKSEDEMRELFPNDPEAFDNTIKIAERCNFDFEFGHYHLPAFTPPLPITNDAYFEKLCWDGFAERYPNGKEEDKKQLEYEIGVIKKMGYVNYFLIVADYINFARKQGIPVGPGRGSAAGSMVAYCMYITDIDPLEYSLFFERFLNPERVSMPDIDVDFCIERRAEVVEYVRQKYGKENVSQIVTFGTMKAKNAIKDTARVLGIPYDESDKIAKTIPNDLNITLDLALENSPEFRNYYDSSPVYKDLIDRARRVEGLPKSTGTHAAAVVIASAPVYEFAPLVRGEDSDIPSIQYNMVTVEEIGLLKMDFLGLRNLTVIENCSKLLRKKKVPGFDIRKIDLHDQRIFDMLSNGSTSGVFQMESPGMTGVCVDLKPQSIEDLTAIVALYRPGPMDAIPKFVASKWNPANISYLTPQLQPILNVTYGCIVYQEQVIEIFRQLGGYSLGQADNIRRAISKKKHKVIDAERAFFVNGDPSRNIPGAVKNGVTAEAANAIYDEIVSFASYAFNKAHAVCYAQVAYETAYLKCLYPTEYMAALMSSVVGTTDKLIPYVTEARENEIAMLGPDVNKSTDMFTVEGEAIRFPLTAIKGVGLAGIRSMLESRGAGYKSFGDFMSRTYEFLNKKIYEGFIKTGAMDCFDANRRQMLIAFPDILTSLSKEKKKNVVGQIGLFDAEESQEQEVVGSLPPVDDFEPNDKLTMEKEFLGTYVSGHPFALYQKYTTHLPRMRTIADRLESLDNGEKAKIEGAAIITGIETYYTKNMDQMATITLEDLSGSIDAVEFHKSFENLQPIQAIDMPIYFTGFISNKNNRTSFAIETLQSLDRYILLGNKKLTLNIPCEEEIRHQIMALFSENTGTTKVIMGEKVDGQSRVIYKNYHTINIPIMNAIEHLLSPDRIYIDNQPLG